MSSLRCSVLMTTRRVPVESHSVGRVRPCVRSYGPRRESTRNAAWARCAAVVGRLWGAQIGAPIEAQRSGFDGERRSKGAQWGMPAGRFPRSGLCTDEGHRRDAPLGRMPTLLGGASIASGYTPPALAEALPRPPCPLKGERKEHNAEKEN